jgi:protease secretion system membrane fusion protein
MSAELQRDTRRIVWVGVAVIAAAFGGFGAWAALAPLDEGVVAPGVVQTESRRKPIQHPVTAVIGKVFVKEGDLVQAGTPLVQLDDAQVSASYLAARSQFLAVKAKQSRLAAESARAGAIAFDPVLAAPENRSAATEYIHREQQLFATRKALLAADISVLDQSVVGAREHEKALAAQLDGRRAQLGMVAEQLRSSRDLAQAGFISRTKMLDEERVAADIGSQVSELSASLARARAQITEIRLRISQRQREFAREVDESASEVRRELGILQERLEAARTELGRSRILAPVDGMVVGLTVQAAGAVVTQGSRIMDIVPVNERLVVEAQVTPDLVDRIRPGQEADVRLTGFPDMPFLAIDGRILSVSADRMEEGPGRAPFFLARVEITRAGLDKLGPRRIQPGMSAEVVIKTGARTLVAYLLKPLVRRVSASMTEH